MSVARSTSSSILQTHNLKNSTSLYHVFDLFRAYMHSFMLRLSHNFHSRIYRPRRLMANRPPTRNNIPHRQRTSMYYGYAFESYCTSDSPTRELDRAAKDPPPGWGGDVNTNAQWCSVVRTKLDDMRMILGGEVDCVRGMCG